jgi:hypothetical protein
MPTERELHLCAHANPDPAALFLSRPGGGWRMQRSRGTRAARNITKSYEQTLVLDTVWLRDADL